MRPLPPTLLAPNPGPPATFMSPRHRHLTAILLVLLHVLGPAVHQLQHALEALRGAQGGAVATCSHASCHARAAQAAAADEVREAPVAWLDAHERSDHGHDHDCHVCTQLHRMHGFVEPSADEFEASERVELAFSRNELPQPSRARQALTRTRAPPRTTA